MCGTQTLMTWTYFVIRLLPKGLRCHIMGASLISELMTPGCTALLDKHIFEMGIL